MKNRVAIPILLSIIMLGGCLAVPYAAAQTVNVGNKAGGDTGVSGAIEQKLILTAAQRSAIYQEVSKDKSKVAPQDFSPVIGADVPPMIDLYTLPDNALAEVPAAKIYRYTMVENQVVVVDPTRMRVIDVIGPAQRQ